MEVGKPDGREFDVEVVLSRRVDVSISLERSIDLLEIVRYDGVVPELQLSDPFSTIHSRLPFGVEEPDLGREEGDEVGGSFDCDGPPEEGKSKLSDAFGGEEEGGRATNGSWGSGRRTLSTMVPKKGGGEGVSRASDGRG